ncbi:TPA: hypothetical protein HA219_01690 [Candidatus Woesearchaeota archaeon]|nr:hypothetical protein [Candidatus Woesearchaeota archaeon]HIH39417.1 hypothetical protein [Candidatus Woesearchaeota archaeon]
MVQFKQRCVRCKKNMVLMTSRSQFPLCYDCEKKELQGEITDPEMKKMFDIPEEYYKNNSFLRSIKKNYLRFGNLTEKQIQVFKKVVEDLKEESSRTPVK